MSEYGFGFRPHLLVGFDKNGEVDFRIPLTIQELNFDQMQQLRAMIPVAIAELEELWRRRPEQEIPKATAAFLPDSR